MVMVAVGGHLFLTDDLEHIGDTNGPDNYALVTITDENIINRDMGALNVKRASGILNDGITFSSKQFTGVHEVFTTNFLFDSNFLMDLTGYYVNVGNFKMDTVNEGKIIATVELHDLNGSFSLIIVGESADFEFTMDALLCEQYGIEIGE